MNVGREIAGWLGNSSVVIFQYVRSTGKESVAVASGVKGNNVGKATV